MLLKVELIKHVVQLPGAVGDKVGGQRIEVGDVVAGQVEEPQPLMLQKYHQIDEFPLQCFIFAQVGSETESFQKGKIFVISTSFALELGFQFGINFAKIGREAEYLKKKKTLKRKNLQDII